MCNIVTELYLYSIVYIYLINSRLDVTNSVRHHFRTTRTLSWCQRVVRISRNRENLTVIESTTTTTTMTDLILYHGVRIVVRFSRNRRENLTVIELTCNNNNNNTTGKSKEEFTVIELTHTAFQEAFREDFEYSDFF